MSPVRNASKALADVMRRSELRGAAAERQRLAKRAQARHESGRESDHGPAHDTGHATADFRACTEPGCAALAEVLGPSSP